jgi:pimeloyl-ACP methyl ester carboxylesterase
MRGPSSAKQIASFPPSEAAFYDDEVFNLTVEAMSEQARLGAQGMIDDTRAIVRPWGFDPHSISVPVQLWYGEDDLVGTTPPSSGRILAATIPQSDATFFPGEAHEAFFTHFSEVLEAALR